MGKRAVETDIDDMQALVEEGRSKGRLTYEEVNDLLPEDVISSDDIEGVLIALGEMDIALVPVGGDKPGKRGDDDNRGPVRGGNR